MRAHGFIYPQSFNTRAFKTKFSKSNEEFGTILGIEMFFSLEMPDVFQGPSLQKDAEVKFPLSSHSIPWKLSLPLFFVGSFRSWKPQLGHPKVSPPQAGQSQSPTPISRLSLLQPGVPLTPKPLRASAVSANRGTCGVLITFILISRGRCLQPAPEIRDKIMMEVPGVC